MRRKLVNLLAAISLVMCLGAVAVGVRSFLVEDYFRYTSLSVPGEAEMRQADVEVSWCRGGIDFTFARWTASTSQQMEVSRKYAPSKGLSHDVLFSRHYPSKRNRGLDWTFERLGFGVGGWTRSPGRLGESYSSVSAIALILPLWFPALLFAILPALWLRRWRIVRRRTRLGLCQHCGYDLRATPGRCPECGTVVAAPDTAPSGNPL
jgi:hypothetical protein